MIEIWRLGLDWVLLVVHLTRGEQGDVVNDVLIRSSGQASKQASVCP